MRFITDITLFLREVEVGPDGIYIVSKTEKYKGLRGEWMIRVRESISEVLLLLLARKKDHHTFKPRKGVQNKRKKCAEYGERMNRMRNDPFRIYIF